MVLDRVELHELPGNHTDEFRTFKMRKSLTMAFVSDWANQTMSGTAANQVKMKLNGSGNCKNELHVRNLGRSKKAS